MKNFTILSFQYILKYLNTPTVTTKKIFKNSNHNNFKLINNTFPANNYTFQLNINALISRAILVSSGPKHIVRNKKVNQIFIISQLWFLIHTIQKETNYSVNCTNEHRHSNKISLRNKHENDIKIRKWQWPENHGAKYRLKV